LIASNKVSEKHISDQLRLILSIKNKKKILDKINSIRESIPDKQDMKNIYLINELEQISQTKTIDRIYYYVNRLIKSIGEVKQGKYNDLNLNQWKRYDDIITDSLWLIDKRDSSGEHSASYWGNFIPQIPAQLIKRYTKKNEWVLDTFLGSGTTMIESIRQNRNCIGIELNPKVIKNTKKIIEKEKQNNKSDSLTTIIEGDSKKINLKKYLNEHNQKKVQLIIMHPPYWDIIKFSDNEKDLSNSESVELFLEDFGKIVDNVSSYLDRDRYFAVVIGDKYTKGEWMPLGFYVMNEILKRNYKLKSLVVKNFDDTSAKVGQEKLWRYRALRGGFYIFKHEYILLFQKK
tara:strand:- start:430 stop:1467 length:1038 start_codon:yes stop_codon:yes gene_type:complete